MDVYIRAVVSQSGHFYEWKIYFAVKNACHNILKYFSYFSDQCTEAMVEKVHKINPSCTERYGIRDVFLMQFFPTILRSASS